jgi:hypothetical protein
MSDQVVAPAVPSTAPETSNTVPSAAPETAAPQNPELTARFTQLAKKEAAIVKEREAIKRQQSEMNTKLKQVEEINQKIQQFENLKQTNKIEALKMLGFTETDIFNALAESPQETPESKMEKIAEAKLQEYQKKQQEQAAKVQSANDAKVIDNFKQSIGKKMATDPQKYEFLNFHGPAAQEQVFELIETHFKNEGELMPLQEALDAVEEFYEQSAREMGEKVSKLKAKAPAQPVAEIPLTPQVKPANYRSQPGAPSAESREAKKQRLIAMIKSQGLKR